MYFEVLLLVVFLCFIIDVVECVVFWYVCKGFYIVVVGVCLFGMIVLFEDIVVFVFWLLYICEWFIELFVVYGYEGFVIFGYVKDGNVYFFLNECFDDVDSVVCYWCFIDDFVEFVLL